MNLRKVLLNARAYGSWRLVRRARGEPLIRVVGDSHTGSFFGDPRFYIHHTGPATAYNLCQAGSSMRSNEKLMSVVNRMDLSREVLILVFGEVDCRIHIFSQYKRRSETVSIAELVNRTVERYGRAMHALSDRRVRFFVYGIPPATHQPNRYHVPYYAPPETRVHIYREFNARLRRFCDAHGFPYIDIQGATSDADGFIAPEYARGDSHLNRKVVPLVIQVLRDAGLFARD